jgi:hypothetical protein
LPHKSPHSAHRHSLSGGRVSWRQRPAVRISNGLVELAALAGGGHVAEFRFERSSGLPAINPLWVPPWKTIDPQTYNKQLHAKRYGDVRDSRLLSGLVGHNLCLDYFGPPSDEEAACGLSFHGEAPNIKWKIEAPCCNAVGVKLNMSAVLPVAKLHFVRNLQLFPNESVVRFTEILENPKPADHYFQWAEHITMGPPFLNKQDSYVVLPATRAMTDPDGYDEGKSLLPSGKEFRWPKARTMDGHEINLSRPFAKRGRGFVTTQLLRSRGGISFVAAVNSAYNVMIAYVFRRTDFPWAILWEENRAITAAPWNSRTQARALEFSNSPFPSGRRSALTMGKVFRLPLISRIAARGTKTVKFWSLLARLPSEIGMVRDIVVQQHALHIVDSGNRIHGLHARDIKSFLGLRP